MFTLGKFSITPNINRELRPFATSGFKCSRNRLMPNRETPGILAISSMASSFSLFKKARSYCQNTIVFLSRMSYLITISTYTINAGYIKFAGVICTSHSCHFRNVGWKMLLCNFLAIFQLFLFHSNISSKLNENLAMLSPERQAYVWSHDDIDKSSLN